VQVCGRKLTVAQNYITAATDSAQQTADAKRCDEVVQVAITAAEMRNACVESKAVSDLTAHASAGLAAKLKNVDIVSRTTQLPRTAQARDTGSHNNNGRGHLLVLFDE
jgi:hypothetical protein